MADRVLELFDEYAAAFARGDRPRAEDFLARAGDDADELARLLDRYLGSTPGPEADEASVAVVEAWLRGEPPLLELRRRRGLRRDDVVDRLIATLGLDPAKREKVKRLYHRLETGLLDARGVSERLRCALREALGAAVAEALAARPRPAPAEPAAYFRATGESSLEARASPEPSPAAEAEWDEIDALFRGGR